MDKETIKLIKAYALRQMQGREARESENNYIEVDPQEALELCDLAIKGLEAGRGVPKDITGLIAALRIQKQCDEDGMECVVSSEAVDEAITILEGLERPDAIIGCALEQAQTILAEKVKLLWPDGNLTGTMYRRQKAIIKTLEDCGAAIRFLNEPALKAWEGMKAENEELKRRIKRGTEVLESYEARFAAINAERAKEK